MGLIGQYTEPAAPPITGPRLEVQIGKPGEALILCFTTDCHMLGFSEYFDKVSGKRLWKIEVADEAGTYLGLFWIIKRSDDPPRELEVLGDPFGGLKSGFQAPWEARDVDRIITGETLGQPDPVPVEPGLLPWKPLGGWKPLRERVRLVSIVEGGGRGSPDGGLGLGGEPDGLGWLGKLGLGPFSRRGGSDAGGPLVGHSPGSANGGGSGGGLGSTKSAVDRPSDMGAGGGHGDDDSTSGAASSRGGAERATGPQDRGTSASPGGPQSRTTNTSAGTESDGASADDDMIGVEYHNGREVRRWKVQQNRTPSETSDPSGLTGDPFLDSFAMRTARAEAGFISGHLGPVRGLYPDAEESGPPSITAISGVMNYDPLAPYASDIYEGRGPRGARGAVSSAGPSPYIEALYPDAGGDAGGETVHLVEAFMRDRPVAAGAGGDPHARVGGFTAVARTIAGAGKSARANRK